MRLSLILLVALTLPPQPLFAQSPFQNLLQEEAQKLEIQKQRVQALLQQLAAAKQDKEKARHLLNAGLIVNLSSLVFFLPRIYQSWPAPLATFIVLQVTGGTLYLKGDKQLFLSKQQIVQLETELKMLRSAIEERKQRVADLQKLQGN